MKIGGREIKGKNRKTVVLPREGSEPVVLVAEAVSDIARINDLLVMPEPPVIRKGSEVIKNFKDEGYQQQVMNYNAQRMAWIIVQSLIPSNIEWDTVDMDDTSTWKNYVKDFREAGLTDVEIGHITNAVLEANSLDDSKLEAARQVFLRGQAAAKNTSGPSTPAPSSPSGTPVNDSESSPQE